MSDPFSVASSAVGIISLGLQVTQGLVTYYSQFKAFDSDIAEISRKADGLHGILQVLEVPLRKFETDNAPVPAQVRTAISASEEGLRNLNGWIEKYGKAEPPANIEDRLRILRKRTLFPFRRDTLLGLKSTLESLQSNLDTAIQVLHLDATHRQYDLVLSVSKAASGNTQAIQDRLQSQAEVMESVSLRLDELVATIQQHQNQPSLLFREPALLASLCDSHHDLRRDTLSVLQPGILHKTPKPRSALSKGSFCFCKARTRTSESHVSSGYLSAFWSQKTQHLPCCPLYARAERTDTLGAKYTYCSKALGNSISVAISITRGAGGFAISPWLEFRAVVSEDSPAFDLFSYNTLLRKTKIDITGGAECILRQLHQLFQEGRASPRDILPDGSTLLHGAVDWVFFAGSLGLNDRMKISILRDLITGLVGAGCKAEEYDNHRMTVLDKILDVGLVVNVESDSDISHTIEFRSLISTFIDLGLSMTLNCVRSDCRESDAGMCITCSYGNFYIFRVLQLAKCHVSINHMREVFDVPEILQAILLQSEGEFIELLRCSPSLVNQVLEPSEGLAPLHLSCLWPRGLSILLNMGADIKIKDKHGVSPLRYAIISGCKESIQLLLDYDSSLECGDDFNDGLFYISHKDLDVRHSFISALKNRRQRLRELALLSLTIEESTRYNLNSDCLLDLHAADITNALMLLGITIEPAILPGLIPRKTTVFHTHNLDVSTAELLFEAGFRDIEGIDELGLSPLSRHIWSRSYDFAMLIDDLHRFISLVEWLMTKGGSIYRFRCHPPLGGTALHDFGAVIGKNILGRNLASYQVHPITYGNLYVGLGEEQRDILINLLTDEFRDSCFCACSDSGCYAITSVFKFSSRWPSSSYILKNLRFLTEAEIRECCMETQTPEFLESERHRCPWLSHEILRSMTFNFLGLTHTCHEAAWDEESSCWRNILSEEEIHEIRSEERVMIEQLENLVADFEAKFAEVGGTLSSFLEEYWKPRMEEVLNAEDEALDEEERRMMREIGVILE